LSNEIWNIDCIEKKKKGQKMCNRPHPLLVVWIGKEGDWR